jgi:hypothetical protein
MLTSDTSSQIHHFYRYFLAAFMCEIVGLYCFEKNKKERERQRLQSAGAFFKSIFYKNGDLKKIAEEKGSDDAIKNILFTMMNSIKLNPIQLNDIQKKHFIMIYNDHTKDESGSMENFKTELRSALSSDHVTSGTIFKIFEAFKVSYLKVIEKAEFKIRDDNSLRIIPFCDIRYNFVSLWEKHNSVKALTKVIEEQREVSLIFRKKCLQLKRCKRQPWVNI